MTSEQPGQSGPQGVLPVPAWDAPDPSEPPGDPFGPGGWAVGNLGYAVDGLVAGATGLLVAEALDVAFTLGGWVSGNSSGRSPILAVGAAFVDLTPAWLKEWAVASFGTGDKAVLFAGMAIVLAVLFVAIGLVARTRHTLATALVGVLGVLALIAQLTRAGASPTDPIPLVAGLAVTLWMLPRLVARTAIEGPSRREALGLAGAAAGVALVVGFSRPIAIPLGLVAAMVLFARWRGRDDRPISRTEYAQGAVALLCCAIAGWIWPAIAGLRTGRSDAYTATMASWRSEGTIPPFVPWLDNARFLLGDLGGSLLLVGLIVGLLAMVLGPWAVRLGLAMRAWCLAYPAYLAAVLDPFTSLFRYLVPLFPLVAVIAGAAGPKYGPRRPYFWVRIGVIAAIFVAGQVWWTVALWEFTPPTDYPP